MPLYEISSQARIEAASAAHAVEAPTAGRVESVHMEVGQEVAAGDILVVLDTERETSRVAEEGARFTGLGARLEALAESRRAEVESASNQQKADRNAIEAAEARHQQAVSALRVAEAAARRTAELSDQGLASAADLERAGEAAEQQRAAVSAALSELEQARWQQQQHDSAHRAELADWDRQIVTLQAEQEQMRAAGQRLDHEVSDRSIRASVSGRLGDVTELRPGSVVAAGDRIALVIPPGELVVVARFPAASALGRVKAGQAAKMRLDAFPWIHHGQVNAEVSTVSSEAVGGSIRVELRVVDAPQSVHLEHGLPGSVAVEVERISPFDLLLRAVGKRLSALR